MVKKNFKKTPQPKPHVWCRCCPKNHGI